MTVDCPKCRCTVTPTAMGRCPVCSEWLALPNPSGAPTLAQERVSTIEAGSVASGLAQWLPTGPEVPFAELKRSRLLRALWLGSLTRGASEHYRVLGGVGLDTSFVGPVDV